MEGSRLGKANVLEHAVDEVASHSGRVLRFVVERRDAGVDDGTRFCDGSHVANLNEVKRRLADAEDERAALLQADVGSAFDEV